MFPNVRVLSIKLCSSTNANMFCSSTASLVPERLMTGTGCLFTILVVFLYLFSLLVVNLVYFGCWLLFSLASLCVVSLFLAGFGPLCIKLTRQIFVTLVRKIQKIIQKSSS